MANSDASSSTVNVLVSFYLVASEISYGKLVIVHTKSAPASILSVGYKILIKIPLR